VSRSNSATAEAEQYVQFGVAKARNVKWHPATGQAFDVDTLVNLVESAPGVIGTSSMANISPSSKKRNVGIVVSTDYGPPIRVSGVGFLGGIGFRGGTVASGSSAGEMMGAELSVPTIDLAPNDIGYMSFATERASKDVLLQALSGIQFTATNYPQTAPVASIASRNWKRPHQFSTGKKAIADFDFPRLASEQPDRLLWLVQGGSLRPSQLTFAAEAVGLLSDSKAVRRVLVPLLGHPEAVVREGAIYGIANHLDEETTKRIKAIAATDSSPGVRQAASESLDD
jgi:HEAT repeat protein